MLRVLLTLTTAAALVLSGTCSAQRSESDFIVLKRVYALVFPDIVRAMCDRQDADIRARAEKSIAESGLLALSVKDVCADDVCAKATGGDRYPTDDGSIAKMVEDFRNQQAGSWKARSDPKKQRTCEVAVEGMESANAKGLKGEAFVDEVMQYLQARI